MRSVVAVAAAAGMAGGVLGAVAAYYTFRQTPPARRERRLTDVYQEDMAGEGKEYVPPLPRQVKQLLGEANLAHLSIQDGVNPPHTCLMNMTFVVEEEDVIVMTTRRDTKKYALMENSDSVSLLIHDFPQVKETDDDSASFKRTLSLSIMGLIRIEGGPRAAKYRDIHLAKNEQYRHFIEGDDKAVITVKIVRCRMCNIQDQVTHWERGQ